MTEFKVGDIVTFSVPHSEYEIVEIRTEYEDWVVRHIEGDHLYSVADWQIREATFVRAVDPPRPPKYSPGEIIRMFTGAS